MLVTTWFRDPEIEISLNRMDALLLKHAKYYWEFQPRLISRTINNFFCTLSLRRAEQIILIHKDVDEISKVMKSQSPKDREQQHQQISRCFVIENVFSLIVDYNWGYDEHVFSSHQVRSELQNRIWRIRQATRSIERSIFFSTAEHCS